jgi:hypothetical protein
MRCEIALTRQHINTSLLFKFGASSLSRHLGGHRYRKLVNGMSCFFLFLWAILWRCQKLNHIASNEWMIDECWIGRDLEVRGYCPNRGSVISLEGQRITTKNLSHYSRCPGRDSNRAHPQCFSRKLPLSLPSLAYKLLITSLNKPQICVLLLISVSVLWSAMGFVCFYLLSVQQHFGVQTALCWWPPL